MTPCPACRVAAKGGAYRGPQRNDLVQAVAMRPLVWEGDVAVLQCERCGGVFVSADQLRRIRDLEENRHSDADLLRALHRARTPGSSSEEPARSCPVCEEELFEGPYRRTGVQVEICIGCGGLFLTEEALRAIEALWDLTRP